MFTYIRPITSIHIASLIVFMTSSIISATTSVQEQDDTPPSTQVISSHLKSKTTPCASLDYAYPIVSLPHFSYAFIPFIEAVPVGEKESYFMQMRTFFHQKKEFGEKKPILTLCGLGGVGKSVLALRYGYFASRNDMNDLIFWIDAETQESISQGYLCLLKKLKVSALSLETPQDIIALVSQYLKDGGYKNPLFIYDNMSHQSQLKDIVPEGPGQILITSRYRLGWPKSLYLDVFNKKESIDYLIGRTDLEKTKTPELRKRAGEIAEEMGHLPLALKHCRSYLKEMSRLNAEHFEDYLEDFKTQRSKLTGFEVKNDLQISSEDWGEEFKRDEQTVATTWGITMEYLSGETDPYKCRELMGYCAYLLHYNIPIDLLKTGKKKLDETIDTGLNLLSAYSMIKKTEKKLSIHPLVQWWIREEHLSPQKNFFNKTLSDIILAYVQRSFTPSLSDDCLFEKTGNILRHLVTLIGHAKTKGHRYAPAHPLLLLGQSMILGLDNSSLSTSQAKEQYYGFWRYNNRSTFFKLANRDLDLGELEALFERSHPLIYFGLGMYYSLAQNNEKAILCWKHASGKGFEVAQDHLDYMHSHGKGYQTDYNQEALCFYNVG